MSGCEAIADYIAVNKDVLFILGHLILVVREVLAQLWASGT